MKKYPDILALYEEKAEYWLGQRAKGAFFEKKYLDWLISKLSPGSTILDLGCGDGWPIATYFVDHGFKVVGVDGTKKMIERAAKRLPQQRWIRADMRKLDLNEKFQAILAWDSFFHLSPEDQIDMFPVFANHLASGGPLVFTSGPAHGDAIGMLDGTELYHSSLSPEEYRTLFAEHGFKEVAYDPEDEECGRHTIWRCVRL